MLGFLLGELGSLIAQDFRVGLATVLTIFASALALSELMGNPITIPQFDKETPRRWVQEGASYWAIKNGFSLGLGFTSRIGFWLWYIIPFSTFLIGLPSIGALIYGAYGTARGLIIWVTLSGISNANSITWLTTYNQRAKKVLNFGLLLVSIVVFVTIGL